MKATIYHNPRCSKSRSALAILQEAPDVEVRIVDYLRQPPTAETLKLLYARAAMPPCRGLRTSEPGAATLADASDTQVLAAMVANPALIERPLVETQKGVRLARPPESVREIL